MANTGRQDMTPVQIAEKVSPERLERHLSSLATIGGMPDGGDNRQVLTVDDRAGRRYLVDLARELDLEISTDAIGNQFFRFPGVDSLAAPAVTTGSHLDTQPTGGRLDGVLGIVAGFEACAAMRDAGFSPHHSIEIVNWTNEEGCRFSPGCMGSMVHVGTKSLQDCLATVDADGITFAEALHDTLVDHPTGAARETGRPMRSYVELHIEQGPVLALAGRPVGVVSSIQGCRWFEIGIFGETRHAGTTPLSARRDALREAVEVVSAISHALSDDRDVLRFTVGRFVVEPGAPNVVPNKVVFTIDLRHPDEAILEQAESLLRRAVVALVNRCDYKIRRTQVYSPIQFDKDILATVKSAAETLSIPSMTMASGAFHDALHLAQFCPSAMIFVPSIDGISHHPAEATRLDDLIAGTRVLTATLSNLSQQHPA